MPRRRCSTIGDPRPPSNTALTAAPKRGSSCIPCNRSSRVAGAAAHSVPSAGRMAGGGSGSPGVTAVSAGGNISADVTVSGIDDEMDGVLP